jgi:hypothetical protein
MNRDCSFGAFGYTGIVGFWRVGGYIEHLEESINGRNMSNHTTVETTSHIQVAGCHVEP